MATKNGTGLAKVSWRPEYSERLFGRLLKWDGQYAVVVQGPRRFRVHRSNLTYEMG